MQTDKSSKHRISVFLTGSAGELLEHVPLKSRGTVISLIIGYAINNNLLESALSPLYTAEQVQKFVGQCKQGGVASQPSHQEATTSTTSTANIESTSTERDEETRKKQFKITL